MLFRILPLVILAAPVAAAPVPVTLAEDGKALVRVVTAEKASAITKANAAKLADLLGRIAGGKFEVATGDGTSGIVVGVASDFPAVKLDLAFAPDQITRREEYVLRTHAKGAYLLGATDLAAQHAIWDFLHRLGYRQYFPGEAWEVVPSVKRLSVALDSVEKPSYHSRRIWYGFGAWDYAKEPYREWCEKNRALGGVQLSTGHAYDGIVKALQKEFDAHPEYWPLLGGERKPVRNPKPELGNADLRKKIVAHALERFAKTPTLDSISMDPSDGGGWSESPESAKLGSVTDQALTLANEVAAALQTKHPGKLVGIYAYNYHSPPPTIKVHPNVVVSVATAFIKGGQSLDEILTGWADKGATLGIREYYSVNTWDRDQPAAARGGNLDYLQRTIPAFHAKGARYMSAESSDNWGPNGLGYAFAARMLWDVREAKNKEAFVADFLEKCFGPAKEPMRAYFEQIDGAKPKLVVDDQLGRMYRALEQARTLADTPAIRRRIDELTLYARYCTLYHRYTTSEGKGRQPAFEALIRHAYRMRKTMLVHTYALYRDLANRDKTVAIPSEATWQSPEGKNPWKSSEAFTDADLTAFRKEGITSHKLVDLKFTPVAYGTDLIPAATRLNFAVPKLPAPNEFPPGRGVQTFLTHVEKGPREVELKVTGGLIAHYRDRGNVKIDAFKLGGASATGEKETLAASDRSVPPDGKEHAVKLTLKEAGLYRITVSDGNDRTQVRWPADLPLTLASTQEAPMTGSYGEWMGYFYVPKGTKIIGLFGGEHGEVRDSEDRPQFWLNGRDRNFYGVAVPEGQDGTIWRVRYARGAVRLLTVPPYFGRTPQDLLLPREVVEKDAGK